MVLQPEISKTTLDDLPDAMFHKILSTVSITEAVRTCILSKRWTHVWRTMSFLDFRERDFKKEGDSSENCLKNFIQFVNCFILLRDNINVDRLRLEFICNARAKPFYTFACGWVFYALRHNTRTLSVPMSEVDLPKILDAVFNNKNLRDLSLNIEPEDLMGCTGISPLTVSLPGVTRLCLSKVYLVDESLNKILKGCPLLDNLELVDCNCDITKLQSETLRLLSIMWNPWVEQENRLRLLSLPNLTDLYLSQDGTSLQNLSVENMPLIRKAQIDLHYDLHQPNLFESGMGNILCGFASVETLKLDGPTTRFYLARDLGSCPMFENLKYLKIGGFCMICNYGLLPAFLCRCPNLVNLKLENSKNCQEEHTEGRNAPQGYYFECNTLRKIEFENVEEDDKDDVLQLQEMLKQNSKGVETVEMVALPW